LLSRIGLANGDDAARLPSQRIDTDQKTAFDHAIGDAAEFAIVPGIDDITDAILQDQEPNCQGKTMFFAVCNILGVVELDDHSDNLYPNDV
jgi:hypothetical protein